MAKRGQNEGSIYKRTDGRWCASITLGYEKGKTKRKSFYGETRKEVQEKMVAALRDLQQGLPVNLQKQTVEQFLDHWLGNTVKGSVRPRTYSSYEQITRLYLKPHLGKIQLTKLAPQHVQKMLGAMQNDQVGGKTIHYTRTVLRASLNRAIKWGLIVRNAATLVDAPRYEKQRITTLTSEQAKIFLDFARENRFYPLYCVALFLGLRLGEASGLRWVDVDFEQGVIRISVALQRVEGKLRLVEPKTKLSKRSLPIPDLVFNALKFHRKNQLTEKLLVGSKWQDRGLVFTTRIGTPVDPRGVLRNFHKILSDAQLPKIRFHDLRHSCATLLLAQGVPARTIMEILGHSQISLTMNTYSHVLPETKRSAIDLLDNLLSSNFSTAKESS